MIKILFAATLLVAPAGVALAADAPAAVAAKAYTTADTPIGTLIDDPASKAVLDKFMPGMSTNPQIDMARSMTLKQIQGFSPDSIKDETLAQIDAELAKLPAKK